MKRHCLCSKDANKCDRESRKINNCSFVHLTQFQMGNTFLTCSQLWVDWNADSSGNKAA